MSWSQKRLERARIAVGLNALTGLVDDWRGRSAELKAWNAKWSEPDRTYGGSYTKAGGNVQLGGSYYKALPSAPTKPRKRARVVPIFSNEQVTNHALNNATVQVSGDGESLFAGAYAVKSITPAGVDRYGRALVELVNDADVRYIVDKSALHHKD